MLQRRKDPTHMNTRVVPAARSASRRDQFPNVTCSLAHVASSIFEAQKGHV